MFVFLNGQFVSEENAVVSVFDRSFLYGDGLFETILVRGGRPFRWAQHLERLTRGAEYLKIRLAYAPKELRKLAGDLIGKNQMANGVLRVHLSRGIGERGYSPMGADTPLLAMTLHEAPAIDPANPPRWRLKTSSLRVLTVDPLSSFKTCNKLPHVVARAEAAAAGDDEALLLNSNGEVTETTSANIFWVQHDSICATPSGRGALPGITRAVLLEICQQLAIPTNKKVIKPETLLRADGVFLTLSSQGLVVATSLDGEALRESTLVNRICQAYWDAVTKA